MGGNGWFRSAFVRATLVTGGIFYVLAGVALLFAPDWFLTSVGPFPPYNRHYMGDTGSFTLALGVGLLLAARDPLRQRLLILVALIGTLLHTGNHAYGDLVLEELTAAETARDLVPLVVYAVLLLVAFALASVPRQGAQG
jgi:predicted anti-sigma-YlaC factor YlaD